MRETNRALLGVSRRAERMTAAQLATTFVDVGSLSASVRSNDHHVIFGRRGTGKTHVLAVLAASAKKNGDVALQIDLRTMGSTGGIYADPSLPLSERASRLLADLLWTVHDGLLECALDERNEIDLAAFQPRLDSFRESICEVRVVGDVTSAASTATSTSRHGTSSAALGVSANPSFEMGTRQGTRDDSKTTASRTVTGAERHRIHFGSVAGRLGDLSTVLGRRRIWLLLDEWSEIPLTLQPFLADLLRRTVFPVSSITVKIAAIEQRTVFRIAAAEEGFIGFETGADAAASLNLDEFMVFDNNATLAVSFFRELLCKHVAAVAEDGSSLRALQPTGFTQQAFTQVTALQELVRAAEGVPRDAINIAALAAQAANEGTISVYEVRHAARQWYQQSKEQAVSAKPGALELLQWIIETVIRGRKARAFLVTSSARHPIIEFLYDSRVLHVLKRGVSGQDTPGVRYTVYAIDYGCYVDLINTVNSPKGLFEAEADGDGAKYVDVPATDYRSIRRAILDIDAFEARTSMAPS